MAAFLAAEPILVLFAVLAVGTAIGMLRVRSFHLGAAAVLFSGLALSAWNPALELPQAIGTLGLAVFAYCIGVTAGGSFFASLRRGARPIAVVAGALLAAGVVAWAYGRAAGLDAGTVAGLYAGGLTNTPALAAATERLGGAVEPTVAYSLTYIGGVMLALLGASVVLSRSVRKPTSEDREQTPALINLTVRIRADDLPPLGVLHDRHGVLFSRVRQGDTIRIATEDVTVRPGDLLTIIGPENVVRPLASTIGEPSDEHLPLERSAVDMRRVVLGDSRLAGRTIAELDLPRKFGAVATRVRRGDVDLLARDAFVVQVGDRVRVTAPPDSLPKVAAYLGDSERSTSDINPLGLALGIVLGLLIGAARLPVGDTVLQLGSAAGPLVVGLILGRLGRTGPVVWTIPWIVATSLQQLSMLLFLAVAGSRAGDDFVTALSGGAAPAILGGGLLVTAFAVSVVAVVDREALSLAGPRTAGILSGALTQPAVLAFANDRAADDRVNLGYTLVFPVAMVTKILVAQILAGL
jgi:putative transport protein